MKTEAQKKAQKRYVAKNKERITEYNKKWSQENKEKKAATKKAWELDNKDKVAEHKRRYRAKNKEKISEYKKSYDKTYRAANKDALREYNSNYYEVNKETIDKNNKAYSDSKKLSYNLVYCIPNYDGLGSNYAGVTNQPDARMRNHKKDGKLNTDKWYELEGIVDRAEAEAKEKEYHKLGYHGAKAA